MSGNLIVAFALFILSVAIAIGLSLFVISVVLRLQHKHRKRLARVGRRRLSGRLDMEDARLMLVRQKQETNLVVTPHRGARAASCRCSTPRGCAPSSAAPGSTGRSRPS